MSVGVLSKKKKKQPQGFSNDVVEHLEVRVVCLIGLSTHIHNDDWTR